MFYLLLFRLLKRPSFYVSLAIGAVLATAYFWTEEMPLTEHLELTGGVSFTPYTKWMGIGGISDYPALYMFLLPILATLPLSDLYARDRSTGFIRFLMIRGKHTQYFFSLFFINFLAGVVTAIFPLLLNIYLSFMKLPNIRPDRAINNEMPLASDNTFFPELYYTHPFVHMMLYVIIIGIFSGMFASIALGAGMFIKRSFIVLLIPFASLYIINMLLSTIGHQEMISTSFLQEQATDGVSLKSLILHLIVGFILGLLLYILGAKKNVVR
ncbi:MULTISPECIES: hypothetical protein [Bacillus]|uniref:Uncharacterized protein n=1 Tax=Bacillus velezensis TaxID=492670 RepID=A0A411AC94_BACVE|nr:MULTISPECIES: hypothetical protein [Bacillus]APA04821.1 hypothetical protein BK055_20790 [Bacillus velezensis]ASB67908.1 hypothetical protein S101413_04496 [Bacillus velezensis]AXS62890.1 hypothetical protein CK238_20450 [Bacillus velezensis]MBZ5517988.1 hypothetical protein [Bacillus sp. KS1]MCR6617270.1 hypothetical protein [Bacillus amyloliquefaciens]